MIKNCSLISVPLRDSSSLVIRANIQVRVRKSNGAGKLERSTPFNSTLERLANRDAIKLELKPSRGRRNFVIAYATLTRRLINRTGPILSFPLDWSFWSNLFPDPNSSPVSSSHAKFNRRKSKEIDTWVKTNFSTFLFFFIFLNVFFQIIIYSSLLINFTTKMIENHVKVLENHVFFENCWNGFLARGISVLIRPGGQGFNSSFAKFFFFCFLMVW